jgi:dCTP deaminase
MALSDKRIREEMEKGNVVIDPFIPENLATSSYDLTLGEWYYREQPPVGHKKIFNPYSKRDVDLIWNTQPMRAEPAKISFGQFNFNFDGISPDDLIILMEPGETILAHTNEFIGGRNSVTTMMKARSSLGRSFINVCKCAGWGDVGYVNRWTMEISNASTHYIIPLVVGRRIAQLVFFETGPILAKDYAASGKYATSTDLETLKKEWSPEQMRPRLWTDRDIKKQKAPEQQT